MDEKEILKLIKNEENEYLDFKAEFYSISDKKSKHDFVKDLLSFANSALDNDAYIICGVNEKKEIVGVSVDDLNDAQWRQTLSKYASHNINFSFRKFNYEKKILIVVKIDKNQYRPIMCKCAYENKLSKGVIYYRNGSSNHEATDLVTIEKITSCKNNVNLNNIETDPTYNKYSKFPPAPYYNFFGREMEMKKVYEKLINHHKNYLLALSGSGGIGKTSIAYKIANDIKEQIDNKDSIFDDVIWISAKDQRMYFDERKELNREFNSIEDLLNKIILIFYDRIFLNKIDIEKKYDIVKQSLEGTKFLFVLDNLEVFKHEELKEIVEFVQDAPQGHKFLLTSRHDLRVQEYVNVVQMDEVVCREYTCDIIDQYQNKVDFSDDFSSEIKSNFNKFYELTNGNPLFIKFFVSQVYKGRKIKDIISKKGYYNDNPLQAYCFESTLSILSEDELKVLYSIAVSDNKLMIEEIKYISSLGNAKNIIEELRDLSIITEGIFQNRQVYSINGLLKEYLIHEKRIPPVEYTRLYTKMKVLKEVDLKQDENILFNFGIDNIVEKNKRISYNMGLNLLNDKELLKPLNTEDILLLYPGNYLIILHKYLNLINEGKNEYNCYSEINSEFINVSSYQYDDEEKNMTIIWKAVLYCLIEKHEDALQELNSIKKTEYHRGLLYMLKGSCYNMLAFDEHTKQCYKKHDEYREKAEECFNKGYLEFGNKRYFHFFKRNLWSVHLKHKKICDNNKSCSQGYKDKNYILDIPLLNGKLLFNFNKQ